MGVASMVSTMMNVKKHEEALRTIALHESNLAEYKNKRDKRSEGNCYFQLGCAYQKVEQLQQSADCFSMCYQVRPFCL